MKLAWGSPTAFDYEGKYYQVRRNPAVVRPLQSQLPIYFGGASDAAVRVAAKHADVYALWGESVEGVKERIAQIRAAAAVHGREDKIRFSLSLRPVLGRTEDEAWARADRILEAAKAQRAKLEAAGKLRIMQNAEAVGAQRLLATAAKGPVVDKRLWTGMAQLVGGVNNSTGLVGTPEQVAESMLDYWELGVSTILIRRFDPIEDVLDYSRTLLPLVRSEVKARQARVAA
jgi:alkanesulfonate monooxygenase